MEYIILRGYTDFLILDWHILSSIWKSELKVKVNEIIDEKLFE